MQGYELRLADCDHGIWSQAFYQHPLKVKMKAIKLSKKFISIEFAISFRLWTHCKKMTSFFPASIACQMKLFKDFIRNM